MTGRLSTARPRLPRARTIVLALVLAFLAWQVAVPIGGLLLSSLKLVRPVDPGYLTSPLTFENFREIIASGGLFRVSFTTLVFALSASILALTLGTYLAWVTTRTDIRLTWLISTFVLLQLAVPDFMFAISWTFLYAPDIGYMNFLWRAGTGAGPLFDIYSLSGMIVTQAFLLMPLVYLFAVPALSALDGTLEDAGALSGASRFRATLDIVIPLVVPALVAIWVIVMMRAWEAFDVPWVLGMRERIMTYATRLYWDTITPPSDTGIISAYAVPMVFVAAALVAMYQVLTRRSKRFGVVVGKPMAPRLVRPRGAVRLALSGLAILLITIGVILPVLMILWMSLNPFYRPFTLDALWSVQLSSFERVVQAQGMLEAVMSSLVVGSATAILLIVVSVAICWTGRVRATTGGRLATVLSFAPIALPNVIVGLAFLWLYRGLGVPITGTYMILILAYFTLFLAIASRNIGARFLQVNNELFDASALSGAGNMRTIGQIAVPMLAPAIAATSLYVVIWSFKELPAALLLSSTGTRTVPVFMFDLSRSGSMSQVAAIAVMTILLLSVLVVLFQVIARRAGIRGF